MNLLSHSLRSSFLHNPLIKKQAQVRMAANLPALPDVEKISTNIIRVMGGNPSKYTLQGSNTYVLGSGPERILLDTGQGMPAWKASLSDALKDNKCSITQCLLSHWHGDHLGGVNDLLSLSSPPPSVFKNQPTLDPDNLIDSSTTKDISDGQKFKTQSGFEVTALHTPGHTADHMCFVITSSDDPSEIGSIFTVDNVLGHGTAVFEDLDVYLSTLSLMHTTVNKAGKSVKAYPGHGIVIDDAAAKIQEYIDHRKMREDEVINVLKYGTTKQPSEGVGGGEVTAGKEWTSMEMVKVIYRHYPESLHLPAEGGVKMVLGKLLKDGRVANNKESGKWKISERATL